MKFKYMLNTGLLVYNYLFGNVRERRQFIIKNGVQSLILPVTPWKYKIQSGQSNKVLEILDTGEALLFGNTKLKRLSFECFFPRLYHEYPFISGDDFREPEACVDLLTKWKEAKQPVRVIITDAPVNLQMAIMTFNWQERDNTRDIYYELEFTEHRELNVKNANNQQVVDSLTGLRERKNTEQDSAQQQRFVDNGLDLIEKSKFAFGDFQSLDKFKAINNVKGLSTRGVKSWKW